MGPGQSGSMVIVPAMRVVGDGTVCCVLRVPPAMLHATAHRALSRAWACPGARRHEGAQAAGISPKGRGVERNRSFGFRRSGLNSQQGQWPSVGLIFFVCKLWGAHTS